MLGGIGAYIAGEISGAVRRNVTVAVLLGLGLLLMICAGGYLVAALHSALALRYGSVEASLFVAGGLFLTGLVAIAIGFYVKNRPRPARPMAATALVAAPLAAKLLGTGLTSKKGWRFALVGGVVVLGALLGRQFLTGDDSDGEA
ncbi:MAG: hypothetical protein Q8S58_05160 [Bosea sp. (in: a-proteobacteria)]|uniref:hypothetical protein n=1 Tax=Bosea sp. (in: a-proteobacteria) TaxID=1871050 RepID=UPI00273577D4|nr:hypothetical protein [Bosea sp. (in: a-proteobacteria)]MDP3257454.1 hypothetical protein [Bosea sp. (in: a-proteobacteria)]MDP3318498.1 hypothetical protein [Bosea sp. (in: a-proteobacteria)]